MQQPAEAQEPQEALAQWLSALAGWSRKPASIWHKGHKGCRWVRKSWILLCGGYLGRIAARGRSK